MDMVSIVECFDITMSSVKRSFDEYIVIVFIAEEKMQDSVESQSQTTVCVWQIGNFQSFSFGSPRNISTGSGLDRCSA